jgi:pyruvate carboxylase
VQQAQTGLRPFRKLLVANRSEIAIRVFRAASELGIKTVAIYSHEDRFALHRFKADESYMVGQGNEPVRAYLDVPGILQIAQEAGVDAIHPGYGFLSEDPDFARACANAGITFIGPPPEVMEQFGSKMEARKLAEKAGIPVMPASEALPYDHDECRRIAERIGLPVMLKASWGGGGRGMRVVDDMEKLPDEIDAARREARAAFGKDEVFLEKLVRRARHLEVQILGDADGNEVHLYERDCSLQRRHQKVIERAPAPDLDPRIREDLCASAVRLAETAGYVNAGTVEFLFDIDDQRFYFIEVNPRIQVEHTVTEEVTGIDIVKAQIRVAQGARIGEPQSGVARQDQIKHEGHALQCRITTEDPQNKFIPDYGQIAAYRGATGFGIRLDGGTAFSGAVITPFYDSLLEKVTAWGPTPEESTSRMLRALREFRIRGVATNLRFLEALVTHPKFQRGEYTTRFIDETPELFDFPPRRDRATRLLSFMGDVLVNGHPEVKGREWPGDCPEARLPEMPRHAPPAGSKQILEARGPEGLAEWMREQNQLLMTDTTMRDAHQSLLATRFRTYDLVQVAPHYARMLPNMFSMECWGGATFDVAMRFLKEDPFQRLSVLRERMPNLLLQMLLRGANGVGYKNYPDNVVRFFIRQSANAGIDIFRVFDSLNWVDNMRVAMDEICKTGKVCEATMCYAGDLSDPKEGKYDLKYYVNMAKELEAAGAHILAIKDMGGLCKPSAARQLVAALKNEVGLPIHFHTHDTSGISAASVLAASEAGVDAADAAMDSMSGLTAQPNLGSICEALRHGERDTGLDGDSIRQISSYWNGVRRYYRPFEPSLRAGASEVYTHGMPGGQFTNLYEQARSMGLEARWQEVAKAYADVNELFGNIVKVTPSSKVVGDMALFMVSNELTKEDVLDPNRDIAFPNSVVEFFRGDLGQPHGGFPAQLQKKVLKGEEPLTQRPGAVLEELDLEAERKTLEGKIKREADDYELASYLMYPAVFLDFDKHQRDFGDTWVVPTPPFFYGPNVGEEINLDIEAGKRLIVTYQAASEPDDEGRRTIFFELNGQPRTVAVQDKARAPQGKVHVKADESDPGQIGAPMPGMIVGVSVQKGETVQEGDRLFTIEAMKMETAVYAPHDGQIQHVELGPGTRVEQHDLVVHMDTESTETMAQRGGRASAPDFA